MYLLHIYLHKKVSATHDLNQIWSPRSFATSSQILIQNQRSLVHTFLSLPLKSFLYGE